jgi:hypothetical protein
MRSPGRPTAGYSVDYGQHRKVHPNVINEELPPSTALRRCPVSPSALWHGAKAAVARKDLLLTLIPLRGIGTRCCD